MFNEISRLISRHSNFLIFNQLIACAHSQPITYFKLKPNQILI